MIRLVKDNLVREVGSEHAAQKWEAAGYKRVVADITKMKVDELRAYAADQGIDLGEAAKKDEILAAINGAEATSAE